MGGGGSFPVSLFWVSQPGAPSGTGYESFDDQGFRCAKTLP